MMPFSTGRHQPHAGCCSQCLTAEFLLSSVILSYIRPPRKLLFLGLWAHGKQAVSGLCGYGQPVGVEWHPEPDCLLQGLSLATTPGCSHWWHLEVSVHTEWAKVLIQVMYLV